MQALQIPSTPSPLGLKLVRSSPQVGSPAPSCSLLPFSQLTEKCLRWLLEDLTTCHRRRKVGTPWVASSVVVTVLTCLSVVAEVSSSSSAWI